MVDELEIGDTGLMVSHGDPVAAWLQYRVTGAIPEPQLLRKGIYPNKGEATVIRIDSKGAWQSYHVMKDPSLKQGKQY